jgi:hypothetical protein
MFSSSELDSSHIYVLGFNQGLIKWLAALYPTQQALPDKSADGHS